MRFYNTLQAHNELRDMVRSFTFTGSLFGNPRKGSDTITSAKLSEMRSALRLLQTSCKNLRRARFEFTWPRKSMPELKFYVNNIVSLHVIAKGPFVSTFDWHTLDFPALINLTLTGVDCATEAVCPTFLRLESLRLEHCSLFNPFRDNESGKSPPCPHLRRVELMYLRDTDPQVLFSFLSRCEEALQTLWIIEPSWSRGGYERLRLDTLRSLRHLGITCLPFYAHLPTTLEKLTIVEGEERLEPEHAPRFSNVDALERLLVSGKAASLTSLSSINVLNAEAAYWKTNAESFQKQFAISKILLSLKYKDDVSLPDYRSVDGLHVSSDLIQESSSNGFVSKHSQFRRFLRILGVLY